MMMNLKLLALLLITQPDCVASTGKARKRASSPYHHAAHPGAPIYAQPGGRMIAYDGRHYRVLEPVLNSGGVPMMMPNQHPPPMQRRIVVTQGSDGDQILPKENRKIRWADEKGIPLVEASDGEGFLSREGGRTKTAPAQLKRVNSILKKRDTGVLLSEEEGEVKQPAVKQPAVKQPEVKQPEVKQPEVKQAEVKQPEVKQPEVESSEKGSHGGGGLEDKKVEMGGVSPDPTTTQATATTTPPVTSGEGVDKVTFSLPSQERPKEGGRYVTKINVR